VKLKLKNSISFVNSSLEAIVHLVKKTENYTRSSPKFCGNALKLDKSE